MSSEVITRQSVELFYGQLNQDERFPIDLDSTAPDGSPVWSWAGFSTKGSAKRSIEKNLEKGVDYDVLTDRLKGKDGSAIQSVCLSPDGFKQWLMMAATGQGRVIRRYFIECEKQLQLRIRQPQQSHQHTLPPAIVNARMAAEAHQYIYDMMEKSGLVTGATRIEHAHSLSLCKKQIDLSMGLLAGVSHSDEPVFKLESKIVDTRIPLACIEIAAAYLEPPESQAASRMQQQVGRIACLGYQQRYGRHPKEDGNTTLHQNRGNLLPFARANNGVNTTPITYYVQDWDLVLNALVKTGCIGADKAAAMRQQLRDQKLLYPNKTHLERGK